MRILQFFGKSIITSLLHFTLIIFFLSFLVANYVLQEQTLKNTLRDSGFYNNIVSSAIDSIDFNNDEESDQEQVNEVDNFINDPEIKNIIKGSISSSDVETQVNGAIDSVFKWARTDNEPLTIIIDLNNSKNAIIDNSIDYLYTKYNKLPECSLSNFNGDINNVDIINAVCKVSVLPENTIKTTVKQQVSSNEVFENFELSSDDLGEENGESIEETLKPVRNVFTISSNAILFVSIALFVILIIYLFVFHPIKKAIELLGLNLLISGTLMSIVALLAKLRIPELIQSSIKQENELQILMAKVVETFALNAINFMLVLTVVTAAIGFVLMSVFHFLKLREGAKNNN